MVSDNDIRQFEQLLSEFSFRSFLSILVGKLLTILHHFQITKPYNLIIAWFQIMISHNLNGYLVSLVFAHS